MHVYKYIPLFLMVQTVNYEGKQQDWAVESMGKLPAA